MSSSSPGSGGSPDPLDPLLRTVYNEQEQAPVRQNRQCAQYNSLLTIAASTVSTTYQYSSDRDFSNFNELIVKVVLYNGTGQTGNWLGANLIVQVADTPTGALVWPLSGNTALYTIPIPSPITSDANQVLLMKPITNFGGIVRFGIGLSNLGSPFNNVNAGTIYINAIAKG